MKRVLSITVAGVMAVVIATPAFAHDGLLGDDSNRLSSRLKETVDSTRQQVEDTTEEVKQAGQELKDKLDLQKEKFANRREELRQKIRAARTERKTRLADKRLEICLKRQDGINKLIEKSATVNQDRFSRIQKVENNVRSFYNDKKLSSSAYDTTSAVVDEKEAAAQASIDVMQGYAFNCTEVDGSTPSGEIKTLHAITRDALKDYRDSVKQLIQVVKSDAQAASAKKAS